MPMQFVPMIAYQENNRIVVKIVPLKGRDNLPYLVIGEKQTVIVVGNFFPNFRNIRLVGRNRNPIARR